MGNWKEKGDTPLYLSCCYVVAPNQTIPSRKDAQYIKTHNIIVHVRTSLFNMSHIWLRTCSRARSAHVQRYYELHCTVMYNDDESFFEYLVPSLEKRLIVVVPAITVFMPPFSRLIVIARRYVSAPGISSLAFLFLSGPSILRRGPPQLRRQEPNLLPFFSSTAHYAYVFLHCCSVEQY